MELVKFGNLGKKKQGVGGDITPGGPASALLLENGDGFLLEDGSFLLLENN
jgi:hypothetical protein